MTRKRSFTPRLRRQPHYHDAVQLFTLEYVIAAAQGHGVTEEEFGDMVKNGLGPRICYLDSVPMVHVEEAISWLGTLWERSTLAEFWVPIDPPAGEGEEEKP